MLRRQTGAAGARIGASAGNFAHPELLRAEVWDVVRSYAPSFLYVVVMFNFVIQMQFITMEKERKVRDAMKQMGMRPLAHWLAWFVVAVLTNVAVSIVVTLTGLALGMDLFAENAFGLYFVLFLLMTSAMTLFGFALTTLIQTQDAARTLAIMWYILTFIAVPIVSSIVWSMPQTSKNGTNNLAIKKGLSVIAPFPFFSAINHMIEGSSDVTGLNNNGLEWHQRFQDGPGYSHGYTIQAAYVWLCVCCVCYAVLTWYLDGALPDENGVAGGPIFFLKRAYWGLKPRASAQAAPAIDAQLASDDALVAAEAVAVRDGAYGDRTVAVELSGLVKTFTSHWQTLDSNSWAGALAYSVIVAAPFGAMPGMAVFVYLIALGVLRTNGCGLGCQFAMNVMPALRSAKVFRAVRGVSLAIDEGELLVLLGHNGAGKSTTINMLTGVLECDGGDATVFGRSIRHEMAQIRQVMGVCPQHDKLFARLTGREHLDLWARLKGVPEERVSGEVAARLDDVLLVASADIFSSSYSGGMQRRLSIALALLGDPKIVFLDEPTTGMDPVTRRQVWDMIMRAKQGRVIMLTTHSMEEADILGDRTAIMSKGELQALGTSIHLKQLYGGGFRISVFAPEAAAPAIAAWMEANVPGATRTDRGVAEGCVLFQVKTQPTAAHFAALEAAKESLGFSEFSVGMATLDDVFLNLSLKDEGAAGVGSLNDDRFVVAVPVTQQPGAGEEPSAPPPKDDCCKVCFFEPTPPGACFCDCCRCEEARGIEQRDELLDGSGAGGAVQNISVMVPDGFESGQVLTVAAPNGAHVQAVVPEGVGAGGTFTVSVPAATDAAAAAGEETHKPVDASGKANYRSQMGALFSKTLTYQSRQRKSMACITCCPFMFILAIVLLNQLWLANINDRLRGNALKKRAKIETDMKYCDRITPRAWMGLISDYNYVPNDFGESDGEDDWEEADNEKRSRYQLYEQPSWEFLVSADGSIDLGSRSAGEPKSSWHMNLLSTSRELALELEKPPVFPSYLWPYTAMFGEWDEEDDTSTTEDDDSLAAGSTDWADWLANFESIDSTTIDTSATEEGLLGHFSIETVAEPILWQFFDPLVFAAYSLLPPTTLCAFGSLDSSSCSAASSTLSATGVSGSCELAFWDWGANMPMEVKGEQFSPMPNEMCNYVPDATRGSVDFSRDMLGWLCSATVGDVVSACADPMTAYTDTCANATFAGLATNVSLLEAVAGLIPAALLGAVDEISPTAAAGLCFYHAHRDAEAGLTVTTLSDEAAVNDALYSSWGGERVNGTARTPFAAYHFYEADASTHEYRYRTWVNYSGTGSQADKGIGGNWDQCWEAECQTHRRNCLGGIGWQCNSYPEAYSESWVLNAKLMNAAILGYAANVTLEMDLLAFPGHFDVEQAGVFGRESINDYFATIFLPYVLQMLMFLITGLIVYEKQERLREIMLMSGLKMETYFVVTYIFYLMQYAALIFVLWVVAVVLGDLQTFQIHDQGLLFVFFFLWGNVMVSFSFMLSSLFSDAKSAVTCTFMLMMLTNICGGAINWGYVRFQADLDQAHFDGYMCVPSFVAFRGIWWLSVSGAAYQPITWENVGTHANGVMARVLIAFAWQWPVCLLLWWYFEKVLATGIGVSQHPLFFLRPLVLKLTGSSRLPGELEGASAVVHELKVGDSDDPDDVVAERTRVQADGCTDPVRLLDLRKVFASRGGAPPKIALHGLSLGVRARECLGMLGHNGAGKTTAISMLCGLYAPTHGDARVLGLSIRTAMAAIHGAMGVCPQHDVLWRDLSAAEHVAFYARLRQVPKGAALKREVRRVLADVALTAWADKPSRSFSGGMKRRLSVACALVGNPRIVYLDEPSTGLDPASRRRLWRVITEFKQRASEGSGVVLTTHSMEEAEVLCDRIAIMSEGRLRCIGHGADIKRRFGEAYKLTIHTASHSDAAAEAVRAFVVSQLAADARPLNASMGGTTDFEMPRASITLSEVYAKVEGARAALGIADWAISETTLEEVFLKISHQTYGAIQDKLAPVEAPAGVEIGVELTQKPAPADDGGVAEA